MVCTCGIGECEDHPDVAGTDTIKVRHLQGDTYQVVELSGFDDYGGNYESEEVLHQGSLSDCEAYIRLKDSGYM